MDIVATIAKNSMSPAAIEKIVMAGADGLRFNLSHWDKGMAIERISQAKNFADKYHRKLQIIVDIPGYKQRIGTFSDGSIQVNKEDLFNVSPYLKKSHQQIFISEQLFPELRIGDILVTGDGELGFKVMYKGTRVCNAIALNSGILHDKKAIHILGRNYINTIDPEFILPQIKDLSEVQPDVFAISFAEDASLLTRIKTHICSHAPHAKLMAKIESQKGVDNIQSILNVVDQIMIARGDLALFSQFELLGITQMRLVEAAKANKKSVMVATQILSSLVNNYLPLRAEINDLTNIVLSGADSILLAAETGISLTPERSVTFAKNIIETVKKYSPPR